MLFSSTSSLPRDEDGMYLYSSVHNVSPSFNDITSDVTKLTTVLKNPALLKVICLQCDLFSLGKVKVFSSTDVEQVQDPFLKLLSNPNPMQSQSQLLWDFMFYNMMGNAYCYVDSNIVTNESNKIYFLANDKMHWPRGLEVEKDKLVFSRAKENEIFKSVITYRYDDGTTIDIPLSKIIINSDLTNSTGNWFKGNSRLDALYKIIANSEAALDSTNINIRYSGKFMVAGTADPKDVSKLPLGAEEKQDIETKVNGKKSVHAVKSMIDIKRFVENIGNLKLDEHYRTAYFLIGSMYNIPKDVLEAYLQGATFENQEKAVGRHISYTLQPKGNDWLQALGKRFNYDKEGKKICIDWAHLPFMQVFKKDEVSIQTQQISALTSMLKLKIPLDEINKYLGTNFKSATYEQPKPSANPGAN